MHRRARHLNPVSAGAMCALDARFLTLANDDAVSSWTGRAGTTVTPAQATSANQPVFKTNVINGQPALYCDDGGTASNAKFLTASVSLTSNALTTIVVAQKTGNTSRSLYARVLSTWNTGDSAQHVGDYGNTRGVVASSLSNVTYGGFNPCATAYRNNALITAAAYTVGEAIIIGFVLDGGSTVFSANGVASTGTTSSTALNSNQLRIGAAPFLADSNMLGHIMRVDVIPAVISAPLRRRLEQAAARSFKLQCS